MRGAVFLPVATLWDVAPIQATQVALEGAQNEKRQLGDMEAALRLISQGMTRMYSHKPLS